MNNINNPVKTIMTKELITVNPETLGSEVDALFKNNNFHHLPVIDNNNDIVGIISSSDYHQLQHHFTRLNLVQSDRENVKIFRSILAKEIMTESPVCLHEDDTIEKAIDILLQNKIHAIVVTNGKKVSGILTALDILKAIKA